jgi:hypothetical protein
VETLPQREKGKSRDKAAKGRQKRKPNSVKALVPEQNGGQSRDKVGEIFGVGARYVSDAKAIKKTSPKLFEQVKSGEKTITQVKRELKERKRESRRRTNAKKITKSKDEVPADTRFATIVADPPWDLPVELGGNVSTCRCAYLVVSSPPSGPCLRSPPFFSPYRDCFPDRPMAASTKIISTLHTSTSTISILRMPLF